MENFKARTSWETKTKMGENNKMDLK